jgi:hypothetical protein
MRKVMAAFTNGGHHVGQLGLVACDEYDIESGARKLNRKLASNAIRRAGHHWGHRPVPGECLNWTDMKVLTSPCALFSPILLQLHK